jgi:membrane protein involved in colicin uptake
VAGAGALDDVLAAVPRRGRSPKAAWLAVVVALVFGLTVGFVMFGGKGTVETVVKYVEVPAKDEQRAAGEQAKKASDESDEDEAEGEEQKVAAKGTRRVAKGGKAAPAAAAGDKDTNASGGGLKGLRALGGVQSGPKKATGETSQASTSGRPLDSGQVQRTVARYTGSVKRSCWQPALSARDKNAPSTARVSVSIQVAPAGNVQSATSSGDPRGYRGLASCITSRVRAWRFPASSGETTVNVPFVFAAQ